jgi:predicted nucleic acid-binding protein
LFVSAVTVLELELWLLDPNTPVRRQFAYGAMRHGLRTLPVDENVAHAAARVGARQSAGGRRMTLTDLLIAATAAVHNLTLATRGSQAFAGYPGLALADWLVP